LKYLRSDPQPIVETLYKGGILSLFFEQNTKIVYKKFILYQNLSNWDTARTPGDPTNQKNIFFCYKYSISVEYSSS